ncbi:hypothetical protein Q428_03435 [Fervidicella metallireducens AeB]|uniref:Zinc metalloprotease n=1 Tax=Fervidicella metallireducens AeB TaxID=1403537 RepID=A0A017RX35_9CLOT|nr:RIP metalloprotease RseP [Fervidicella metallireducens]EYE89343.1 hypothetical protein Q428_03435 [Fervidicella metallireducens AeB]
MTTFLATIFVFGLLITSHEFGHFIMAKSAGIKVLEFSIGMGPKILGFNGVETNYTLRLLPIGGYVKMLGEEEESSDPRAFCNKGPWRRLSVIVAGAFMNFVIAILLFFIVSYNIGVYKPVISKIEPNYPAETAGLKVNDKILKVNNKDINTWNEFILFISENKEKPFNITFERQNQLYNKKITPFYNNNEKRYMIGISPTLVKGNVIESFNNGFRETFTSIKQMIAFLGGAIRGKISSADVGGPIAIVKMSGEAARSSIWSLLAFAGFLSINLGVINLIPFPALDGGWVVIILIEALTGKKIDEDKIGVINLIGFSLLITLMIFVTYKDIIKLF